LKKRTYTAIIIGSGNVARLLSLQLQKNGIKIRQVYSKTKKNAIVLARELNAGYVSTLSELDRSADYCIIAVSDDSIIAIGKKLRLKNTLVVHTSGTVSIDLIKNCSSETGVLYPLQTFQKNSNISFKEIPLLIEANNKTALLSLKKLAGKISNKIIITDSEKRKIIHLAAVFANNFTNHLFSIAEDLLMKSQSDAPGKKPDIKILLPLIKQTVRNLENNSPSENQTGPAIRGDKKTIKNHLKMLKNKKTEKAIYKILTRSIQDS